MGTTAMELRLPQDKLRKLQELLQEWQFKKVCTRRYIESYLNPACKVVRPDRSFIGRLIAILTQAKRTHRTMIRINNISRSVQISGGGSFVSSWNGVSRLRELRKHPNRNSGQMRLVHGEQEHCGATTGSKLNGPHLYDLARSQ
jgi:hypothetical protein